MKIFITGGSGFIGSNIADYYLNRGIETVVYDNLSRPGVEKNLTWLKKKHPKMIFEKSDIRDFITLKNKIRGSEIIYHMASQVAVTTSVTDPRTDFEVNALGTLNVLEAARIQKKPPIVIYASTNKVYGGMENIKLREMATRYEFNDKHLRSGINEMFQLDFHSPYGCSKGAGDQYVHDYARIYGLKTIVFRQSCIYGNHQFGNEDQGWVAYLTLLAMKKKPITIFGDGKQVRDILYVSDLIDCFLKGVDRIDHIKGEVFNIGGGKENVVSLLEFVRLLEETMDKKISLRYQPWRPGDQKVYISDTAKARRRLGWKPKINVKRGLKLLYTWLKTA